MPTSLRPESLLTLVDRLPLGVTVWRAESDRPEDLRLVYANPRAALESGVDEAAVLGTTVGETYPDALVAPADANIPAAWLRVATTGKPELLERVPYGDARHPHGWFDVNIVPLGDRLVASVYQNVTARVRSAETIGHQNEELARSNRELEQFAYAASHDLQSPLRTIGGFVELLLVELGPTAAPRHREFLELAWDGVRQLRAQVEALLSYSRVGRETTSAGPVDLGEVLADVRRALASTIAETGAVVEAGDLPVVHGVPSQMRQLLQNLVENALKYRAPDTPPRVEVRCVSDASGHCITVADNGLGVDPRYRDRIFGIFRRVRPRGGDPGGTGIGLALCRKIVTLAGGRIWVEERDGGGSRFIFTLPATPKGDR
jgi:signal transduction histidine kinase